MEQITVEEILGCNLEEELILKSHDEYFRASSDLKYYKEQIKYCDENERRIDDCKKNGSLYDDCEELISDCSDYNRYKRKHRENVGIVQTYPAGLKRYEIIHAYNRKIKSEIIDVLKDDINNYNAKLSSLKSLKPEYTKYKNIENIKDLKIFNITFVKRVNNKNKEEYVKTINEIKKNKDKLKRIKFQIKNEISEIIYKFKYLISAFKKIRITKDNKNEKVEINPVMDNLISEIKQIYMQILYNRIRAVDILLENEAIPVVNRQSIEPTPDVNRQPSNKPLSIADIYLHNDEQIPSFTNPQVRATDEENISHSSRPIETPGISRKPQSSRITQKYKVVKHPSRKEKRKSHLGLDKLTEELREKDMKDTEAIKDKVRVLNMVFELKRKGLYTIGGKTQKRPPQKKNKNRKNPKNLTRRHRRQ